MLLLCLEIDSSLVDEEEPEVPCRQVLSDDGEGNYICPVHSAVNFAYFIEPGRVGTKQLGPANSPVPALSGT